MTQEDRLYHHSEYDLLWATVKYDELFQQVIQNLLIIERGHWRVFLYDCGDDMQTYKLYQLRRKWLFKSKILDEDELRKEVINRMMSKK